jgi:HK97 family phage prohead protease
MNIIKSASGSRISDTRDFVLSTESPDRVGDIVKIDGLNTKNFESNPVALFMHNHREPIGIWSNLKKVHGALIGTLNIAAKGTSRMVDFSHSMVEQGMLKAVSVSFIPTEATRNPSGKGLIIHKSELVEVSLVTVPMNPQALMIAKSLNLSDDEINSFFSQPVNRDPAGAIHRAKLAIIASKRCVNL